MSHRISKGYGDSSTNSPLFHRLANSQYGQNLLARSQARAEMLEQQAQQARSQISVPHLELTKRRLAEANRFRILSDATPVVTKYDAFTAATQASREIPSDYGLRRTAVYLRKVWEQDRDGTLSVAAVARMREQLVREFPKSAGVDFFDRVLPNVQFRGRTARELYAIAQDIHSQKDYDSLIEAFGLAGNDSRSRAARRFILGCINRRAQMGDGGPGVCDFCGESAEHVTNYPVPQNEQAMVCDACKSEYDQVESEWSSEEPEKEAVAPPGWESTVKKLKKEKDIDNPWALAWWMKDKGYTPGGKESHRTAQDQPQPNGDGKPCAWCGEVGELYEVGGEQVCQDCMEMATGDDGDGARQAIVGPSDFASVAAGDCSCGGQCPCDCGCAQTGQCVCGPACPCECGCGSASQLSASRRRAEEECHAGDAPDAGEQEFHPDVVGEREDAVSADKIVRGRRADKPSEPEFKPSVNQQQDDSESVPESDAKLKAKARRRARIKSMLSAVDLRHIMLTARQVQELKADIFDRLAQAEPEIESDEPQDIEMAHEIEDIVHQHTQDDIEMAHEIEELVEEHIRENLPAEMAEGHLPTAHKLNVDRRRIENALLEDKTIKVMGFTLRVARRNGREHIELPGNGPPMAWPIRRMTAAIDYFAKVVEGQVDDPDAGLVMCTSCGKMSKFKPATGEDGSEYMECQSCGGLDTMQEGREGRRAQSIEAPKVNEQQPDAVKPPSKDSPLGEESSQEDLSSLEADSIDQQHPAQDQPGTSDSDFEGLSTSQEGGVPEPGSIKTQHPADDQSGVSLTETDLGRHSSDEEPKPLEPTIEPSSKEAKRDLIRRALRGGFSR